MGSYAELYIGRQEVGSSKSFADPLIMTMFREQDKRIYRRLESQRPWYKPGDVAEEDDAEETAYEYAAPAHVVADRLDIMGFTLQATEAAFEAVRVNLLDYDDEFDPSIQYWKPGQRETIASLKFSAFVDQVRDLVEAGLDLRHDHEEIETRFPLVYAMLDKGDLLFGNHYDDVDPRHAYRVLVGVVPPETEVILDYSELVHGGWYAPEDPVGELAAAEVLERYVEKVIVLTEGWIDSQLIRGSMEVRFPHLVDYYTFPDFVRSNVAGGASNLVATIKAFVSASIRQRVVAVFDNDTAASVALRGLSKTALPDNIKVIQLPELELARDYPTIGPQGRVSVDVNGLAAGLELYFGRNVLTGDDGELVPVQWKGWDATLNRYQGEVLHKEQLQEKFGCALAAARSNSSDPSGQDWSGIDAICYAIFRAFTT